MTPSLANIEFDKTTNDILLPIISNLSVEGLNTVKRSIREELTRNYVNLLEKNEDLLYEMQVKSYKFSRKEDELLMLDNITLQDIKEEFNKIFYTNPNKLSIQIHS